MCAAPIQGQRRGPVVQGAQAMKLVLRSTGAGDNSAPVVIAYSGLASQAAVTRRLAVVVPALPNRRAESVA